MFFKQNNDKYPSSFQLKIINYPKIMGNCRVETINVILKLKHFIKSLSSDIEQVQMCTIDAIECYNAIIV